MSEKTWWETIKVEGGQLVDKVRELIEAGNVRRIVVKQQDRTIAEFPLTVGVVGAVVMCFNRDAHGPPILIGVLLASTMRILWPNTPLEAREKNNA